VSVTDPMIDAYWALVPERPVLETISTGHLFTEGPVWDSVRKALHWTDIVGDTIWSWKPGVGRSVFVAPSGKANGMTIDHVGRLVVAGWSSRSVWTMDLDGSRRAIATHHAGVKLGTPNDIVVRSDGSIYWTDGTSGTRAVGFEAMRGDLQLYRAESVLFRLSPGDDEPTLLTDEVPGCNGLAFSPDETLLYVNDSPAHHIKVFDVEGDGGLSNGRVFIEGTGGAVKVDCAGNVYSTGRGGVHVIDPAGRRLGRILLPDHCSNLAWGGAEWRDLYVTGGGSLYRISLLAQGIPVGVDAAGAHR
jgi:gluconolactonase